MNYYRLVQVDFGVNDLSIPESDHDGLIHFSETIAVSYSPPQFYHFDLSATEAHVELLKTGQAYVVFFDQRGVVVFSKVFSGPVELSIPIHDKTGIWYACLIYGGKKELMGSF